MQFRIQEKWKMQFRIQGNFHTGCPTQLEILAAIRNACVNLTNFKKTQKYWIESCAIAVKLNQKTYTEKHTRGEQGKNGIHVCVQLMNAWSQQVQPTTKKWRLMHQLEEKQSLQESLQILNNKWK